MTEVSLTERHFNNDQTIPLACTRLSSVACWGAEQPPLTQVWAKEEAVLPLLYFKAKNATTYPAGSRGRDPAPQWQAKGSARTQLTQTPVFLFVLFTKINHHTCSRCCGRQACLSSAGTALTFLSFGTSMQDLLLPDTPTALRSACHQPRQSQTKDLGFEFYAFLSASLKTKKKRKREMKEK